MPNLWMNNGSLSQIKSAVAMNTGTLNTIQNLYMNWGSGSQLVWQNWQLKSGSYYSMTSNNSPAPFTVTAVKNTANVNVIGNPWQAADSNWQTGISVDPYSMSWNMSFGVKVDFGGRLIIPKRIYMLFYTTDNSPLYLEIKGYDANGTEFMLKTADVPVGDQWIELGTTTESAQIRAIQFMIMARRDLLTQMREVRVVEWFQKG